MLSVELGFLAEIMEATGHGSSKITSSAQTWCKRTRDALWNTTVRNLARVFCLELTCTIPKIEGGIFAYETNGLGSKYFMDDANVPVRRDPLKAALEAQHRVVVAFASVSRFRR
jgi:meiotically up-regulated gene 157 (Mug157) protein